MIDCHFSAAKNARIYIDLRSNGKWLSTHRSTQRNMLMPSLAGKLHNNNIIVQQIENLLKKIRVWTLGSGYFMLVRPKCKTIGA